MSLSPKKVLVVDDEEAIRDSLSLALEELGWEVCGAHCAEAALDYDAPFDAYLVDVSLPDRDGFDLIKELQGRFGKLPVIIFSGYLDNGIKEEAHALGVDTVLRKPFRFEEIDRLLTSMV